jgi:hypothetical protein
LLLLWVLFVVYHPNFPRFLQVDHPAFIQQMTGTFTLCSLIYSEHVCDRRSGGCHRRVAEHGVLRLRPRRRFQARTFPAFSAPSILFPFVSDQFFVQNPPLKPKTHPTAQALQQQVNRSHLAPQILSQTALSPPPNSHRCSIGRDEN